MNPTIFHNPRCRKSRETLALIEQAGYEPTVVEYLKEPPSAKELDRICVLLGMEPVELVRTGEPRLKDLGISVRDDLTRDEWLDILSSNPILIQRPIVVVGDRAVVGRPPANVESLL